MTTRKTVILALFIALGILLQLMESFIPILMIVPGFKIGFANLVSVMALMIYDRKSMWIVSLSRIILSCLLQGTLFGISFYLSFTGGLVALIFMSIADRSQFFSIYGISILGAAGHSIGQVLMVTWIYQQYFMQLYLPILLALSIVSGFVIAMISQKMMNRLKGNVFYG